MSNYIVLAAAGRTAAGSRQAVRFRGSRFAAGEDITDGKVYVPCTHAAAKAARRDRAARNKHRPVKRKTTHVPVAVMIDLYGAGYDS